jgi:hypothetical protein
MIDDNDEPILMDLGSVMRARVRIDTRQQALTQQAEHHQSLVIVGSFLTLSLQSRPGYCRGTIVDAISSPGAI